MFRTDYILTLRPQAACVSDSLAKVPQCARLYEQLLGGVVRGFGTSRLGEVLEEGELELDRDLVADEFDLPSSSGIDLRVVAVATVLLIARIAFVVTDGSNRD